MRPKLSKNFHELELVDNSVESWTNHERLGATRSRLDNIMKIEIIHCPT